MSDVNATDVSYVSDLTVVGLSQPTNTSIVVIETLTLVMLWSLSLTGNMLVCVVIRRSRRIQSTTNYFVLSLAMSDLCVTLICVPFVAARIVAGSWLAGQFFCKLVRFVQHMAPSVTIFVLLSITVDRFYTIIYPLSFKVTRGTAKKMIILAWILAGVLSCFCFYFYDVVEVTRKASPTVVASLVLYVCPAYPPASHWTGMVYILTTVTLQFLLPTFIVGVGYGRLVRYIWTASAPGRFIIQRTANPVPRTKVKMMKMLMVVTLSTLAMLAPLYLVELAYCLQPNHYVDRTAFIFAFWMLVATGVSKPLLYLYFNANFRRGCKEVFCMSTMRCYRSHTYTITTASSLGKKNYVGIMDLNSNSTHLACDTPVKAFNRALYAEKSAWPLNGTLPSTYV